VSRKRRHEGDRPETFQVLSEIASSVEGTCRYKREGGVVHGDASGEWTLDEDGEVEDIVSFVSPRWSRRKGAG
jgi:hypothetical protein